MVRFGIVICISVLMSHVGVLATVPGGLGAQSPEEKIIAAGKHNNEGIQLVEQGRFRDAIRSFRLAISLVPNFASAYFNMGRANSQLKDFDEAVRAFGKAVQIKPDYADAWYHMGIAFQALNRFEDAQKTYETLSPMVSESPHLLYRLGYVSLQIKDWDKTAHYWERLADGYPDHPAAGQIQRYMPQVYFNQGTINYHNGKLKAAEKAFELAMQLQPGYAEAHYNAGLVFRDLKRYDEALRMLRDARKLNYDYVKTQAGIAGVYALVDSFDQAVQAYEALTQNMPNHVDGYTGLVNLMLKQGYWPKALAYGTSAAVNLATAKGFQLLAFVYEHNAQGKRYGFGFDAAKALKAYEQGLTFDPDDIDIYYNIGVIQGRMGNWEAALKAMSRAGELDPDHAGVKKWLPVVKERYQQLEQ